MAIPIILVGAVCVAFANLFMRRAIDAGGDAKAYLAVQLSASLLVAIVLNPIRTGDYRFSVTSAALGLLAGLVLGTMMWGLGRSLELGPPGLSLAMLNSASALPAVVMYVLFGPQFGHDFTIANAIGSTLVIVGLFWAGLEQTRGAHGRAWLSVATIALIAHASLLVIIEWRSLLMHDDLPHSTLLPFSLAARGATWFLPAMFFAAATFHVVRFVGSVGRRLRTSELAYGLLGGAGMGSGTWCLLGANEVATVWENAMLFPTYCIAIIVLCNLWGRALYAEHVNWWATALCISGIALGTIDWQRIVSQAPQQTNHALAMSSTAAITVPAAGTQAMAARLQSLVASSDRHRQITAFGPQRVAALRAKLATTTDIQQRLVVQMLLGRELMLDGRTTDALTELNQVVALIEQPEVMPSTPFLAAVLELQAVAYLRLGEQQNCITRHSNDSCIMPIRGSGVHTLRDGSTAAVKVLTRALTNQPDDLRYRWLLNLVYMTLGEYPDGVPAQWRIPPSVFDSDYDIGRFYDVAAGAKVDTVTLSGGVITDDFDGDGLLDIMISDWGINNQMRFYHNAGDGTFTDQTELAGLIGEVGGLNLVQADYDNDGDVDVLVLRGAWLANDGTFPNSLLRNNGNGTFEDVTESAGLLSFHPTQTASWADYDGDGRLDLFIGNESTGTERHPCELYRNGGDGTFTNLAAAVGLANVGFVKGTTWGDYNNDGRPDLYLSRFGEPNVLFRNDGPSDTGWVFTDVTAEAGVGLPLRSFPTWFFDYDNDGWQDLLVASFAGFTADGQAFATVVKEYLGLPLPHEAMKIALYHNNADGTFTDVAQPLGIDAALLAMGGNFGDLDNDGFFDCYFGTGDPDFSTLIPNRMFRNDRGQRFQDVTTSGGFGHLQKGHGIAFADMDNDGDQDIYAVMGGAHTGDVYQNALFENPGHGNHWLTLRLEGVKSNRSAIGARVKVSVNTFATVSNGKRDIYVTVGSGGSFGASSLQQEIGLGDATSIRQVEIVWPGSGLVQTFADVPIDRVVKIKEGETAVTTVSVPSFQFKHTAAAHHH